MRDPEPLPCGGLAADACAECLRHAWLLGRLGGHLERVRHRLDAVLALSPAELVKAVGGARARELLRELTDLDPASLRLSAERAELEIICRCHPRFPPRLLALQAQPAVLHVAGGLERFLQLAEQDPVAIVGARRASEYGIEAARGLARGLASAGLTVLSGMALGIDSAAHAGALEANRPTVAVMPGPAQRPYPSSKRGLHRRIIASGAAVSELPPRAGIWRWGFPARNRIVAALATSTVVVEAGSRSGALITARVARSLGRPVGAVPGRVTSPQAHGPNALLAEGAYVVRGAQDVLDRLLGIGAWEAADLRPSLSGVLGEVLEAVAAGHDTPAALVRAGHAAATCLEALAELELHGYLRRASGGRYALIP